MPPIAVVMEVLVAVVAVVVAVVVGVSEPLRSMMVDLAPMANTVSRTGNSSSNASHKPKLST